MVSLEGGCWKSAQSSNSLAAYPTSRTVLKTSPGGDPWAEFDSTGLQASRILSCGMSWIIEISVAEEIGAEPVDGRQVERRQRQREA
jgi:hypothetical protein